MKLIPRLADTVAVVAVHHEDQTLCVLEVVPPQRPDLQQRVKGHMGVWPAQTCFNSKDEPYLQNNALR